MGGHKTRKTSAVAKTDLPPHLALLESELKLANVALPEVPGVTNEAVLAELSYALAPPIHEEKQPAFGAIVTPASGLKDLEPQLLVNVDADQLAHHAANGTTSFVHVAPSGNRFVMFKQYVGGEYTLANIARQLTGLVIQRDQRGIVRVYTGRGVYVNRGRTWWRKHDWHHLADNLIEHVPQADDLKLNDVMSLAVHVLSPTNTGATLVWWLTPPTETYDNVHDLSGLKLQVTAGHFSSIQHLLAQYDGATIIGPDGSLLAIGAHLHASDRARAIVPETRGTRHTSARRYSFDQPRVLVVTISQDGPVSVFSDGAHIGEVAPYSALDALFSLDAEMPENSHRTMEDSWNTECPHCGKTMRVETLTIAGWRERETANCQVCGAEIASKMCWKIDAHVVKNF